MTPRLLVATLLLAPGCHLFGSATIGQTCEDLPGGCGGIDTASPDTAPPFVPDDPYSHHIVSGRRSEDGVVRLLALGPDLEAMALVEIEGTSEDPGPVAWDPETGRLWFYDNGTSTLHAFAGEEATDTLTGTPTDIAGAGPVQVRDLFVNGETLVLLAEDALYTFSSGAEGLSTLVAPGRFHDLQGLFPAYAGNAYVVELDSDLGRPDLYRVDLATGGTTLSHQDFDDSRDRAVAGLVGPDGEAFVCSSVGAFYDVSLLQSGTRAPAAFPDADALDAAVGVPGVQTVTDCGYDPAANAFLFFSPETGVVAMDPWGRVEPRGPSATGLFRAAFP